MKIRRKIKSQKPVPIHLFIRFSDKLGFIKDTIQEHSQVIKKRGAVWFGKMGKPLAQIKIARFNEQCENSVLTYLFLVQKGDNGNEVYRAKIVRVARDLPEDQTRFVPAYYYQRELDNYMRLWIKVSQLQKVTPAAALGFVVSSSGMPVLTSLGRSMSAIFIVRKKTSLKAPPEKEIKDSAWDF